MSDIIFAYAIPVMVKVHFAILRPAGCILAGPLNFCSIFYGKN
jgi:hypothetical protein